MSESHYGRIFQLFVKYYLQEQFQPEGMSEWINE